MTETAEEIKVLTEKALTTLCWPYKVQIQEGYAGKDDKAVVIDDTVVIYRIDGEMDTLIGKQLTQGWAVDVGVEGDVWCISKGLIQRGIDAVSCGLLWFAEHTVRDVMNVLEFSQWKPEEG